MFFGGPSNGAKAICESRRGLRRSIGDDEPEPEDEASIFRRKIFERPPGDGECNASAYAIGTLIKHSSPAHEAHTTPGEPV